MPKTVTVVGGGLAGLVAANVCAEAGVEVVLHEARSHLGGRATTAPGEFATNYGPHAFYAGPLWDWLIERQLTGAYRVPKNPAIKVRWNGNVRATPPLALLRTFRHRKAVAPVDVSLRDWLNDLVGEESAAAACGMAGVLTFDHDPGRLSARFVWEKVDRILLRVPPSARYVVGGWGGVVDRLADRARGLGVKVHTGSKLSTLDELATAGPVIVAVAPRSARTLTGITAAHGSPRVALLDLGVATRRRDPYIILDLDEGAFIDRYSAIDSTLAPEGKSLFQASIGQRPGESTDAAIARIEEILDRGVREWRDREMWRRSSTVFEATGALDAPGTTWRDRQPVTVEPGLHLAGDWVAAPGHLSEVSWHSANLAAHRALAEVGAAAPDAVTALLAP